MPEFAKKAANPRYYWNLLEFSIYFRDSQRPVALCQAEQFGRFVTTYRL
jgi:hypothetical protein